MKSIQNVGDGPVRPEVPNYTTTTWGDIQQQMHIIPNRKIKDDSIPDSYLHNQRLKFKELLQEAEDDYYSGNTQINEINRMYVEGMRYMHSIIDKYLLSLTTDGNHD